MTTKKQVCDNLYRLKEGYNPSGILQEYVYVLDLNSKHSSSEYWTYVQFIVPGEEGLHYMYQKDFCDCYRLVNDV